jgi:hypothetical protein
MTAPRLVVIAILAILGLAPQVPAPPPKAPRTGFIGAGSPTAETGKYIEPFRQDPRDHGHVEGQNPSARNAARPRSPETTATLPIIQHKNSEVAVPW